MIGDDPNNPRFIQTIPGRGYRFIAPVQAREARPIASAGPQLQAPGPLQHAVSDRRLPSLPSLAWAGGTLIFVAIVVFLALLLHKKAPEGAIAHGAESAAVNSIAVVPFANWGAGASLDYLRYALASDIITDLTYARSLSVRPLASTYWTGWGRMHSKTAGDYFLYVQIFPESRRMQSAFRHTFVNGKGSLCTPGNERYSLKLKGSMPPHLYLSTARQLIALNFDNWRNNLLVGHERRPYFSIRGRWGQREIAGDDDQTLSHAFFPNGTLRPAKSSVLPAETEDIQLTLHEGTYSQWEAACAAARQ